MTRIGGCRWRSIARGVDGFAADDSGQDLVEYALLTSFLGLCALAAWISILEALGMSYGSTTSDVQDLWDPPPPSGSS